MRLIAFALAPAADWLTVRTIPTRALSAPCPLRQHAGSQ
jgi:hypothetical protein